MISYPPCVPLREEVEPFNDGLWEIVPEKISELLEKIEKLKAKKTFGLKVIKACVEEKELDDFGEYFWTLYVEFEFSKYYLIQKWLRYWLEIYEELEPPLPEFKKVELSRLDFPVFDLEQFKLRPIEEFYDGKLRVNGSRLMGLCPFHKEKTPSFFIFRNDNHFHCFSCQAHGNVINFIMQKKKCDFKEAIRILT